MSVMSLICAAVVATGLADTNSTPRVRMSPRVVVPEAASVAVDLSLDKPVEEVVPVDVVLPIIFPAETNLPTKVRVPEAIAKKLADAVGSQVPSAIAQALAETTEANLPSVLAAVYAKMMQVTVPGISQVDLVKVRLEWYEKFVAVPASKAWWVLKIAQEKAAKGESVENLRLIFEECMKNWLADESDE